MNSIQRHLTIGAIVFDLDGTLVDSRADIAAAVNHVLGRLGFATLPLKLVMGYVGDGARQLIVRASGLPPDSPDVAPLFEQFLDYYTAHAADQTTWMPGACEALEALRHYPLSLCTNKPRVATLAVLQAFGAIDRFATIVCGGDLPRLKPDPMPLHVTAGKDRLYSEFTGRRRRRPARHRMRSSRRRVYSRSSWWHRSARAIDGIRA